MGPLSVRSRSLRWLKRFRVGMWFILPLQALATLASFVFVTENQQAGQPNARCWVLSATVKDVVKPTTGGDPKTCFVAQMQACQWLGLLLVVLQLLLLRLSWRLKEEHEYAEARADLAFDMASQDWWGTCLRENSLFYFSNEEMAKRQLEVLVSGGVVEQTYAEFIVGITQAFDQAVRQSLPVLPPQQALLR